MVNWDSDIPYFQRQWFRNSVELHAKDHGHRFYRPTPRWCPGVERERDFPDKRVFWGCVVAFILSVLWGVW